MVDGDRELVTNGYEIIIKEVRIKKKSLVLLDQEMIFILDTIFTHRRITYLCF